MLKGLVRSERPVINSNEELLEALLRSHQTFFIDLLESMPRRMAAVVEAEGGIRNTNHLFFIKISFPLFLRILNKISVIPMRKSFFYLVFSQ